jgi:hypothetical protein
MDAITAPIIVVIRHPMRLQIADATGPVANISPVNKDRIKDT